MKTAVIYARYSSDKQTEQSIEGQLRVCYEFAERNDYKILGTYIDRAISGKTDNRAEFQLMLKDSNKMAWDAVLVYKLDRFSRNKYEMAIHKKTLRNNGVKVISATENIPDTPEGIILESLLEGMAEYYSAELSQKVKRGMNESRIKGNFTGGKIPYGFATKDKKIIPHEERAKIVRYIYEKYAEGCYAKDIIASLTKRGVTYNGKPFAKATIYRILKSEKYTGVYHYEDKVFTNLYPKIVPDYIYNVVQKKIQENAYGRHDARFVYLLKNKIVCGYCGQSVVASSGTSKNGKVWKYYKCRNKILNKNHCSHKPIGKEVLEDIVIQVTHKALTPSNLTKLADAVLKRIHKENNDQLVLKNLEKQYARVNKEINNLLDFISQGVCTKSTKERLVELETKKEELEKKILDEKTSEMIKINDEEIIGYIKKALKKKPKALLQTLIKKIILYEDKIEIYFNYTDRTIDNPDNNCQDFLLYQEVVCKEITITKFPKYYTKRTQWNVVCYV